MEKITGIIESPPYKNGNGFVILKLRVGKNVVTVTGEDQDLYEADVVECEGDWSTYKGMPQFKAKKIIPQIPSSPSAIADFLKSGRIKGISTVFANRLVEAFGMDVFTVIEQEPHKLKKVPGFGAKRIKDLTEGLQEQIVERKLLLFLHNFGLSKKIIKKISNVYGLSAYEKISEDPYQLSKDISGIGFNIADRIGLKIGIDPAHPSRVVAGILHALNTEVNSTGNTGLPESQLIIDSVSLLSKEKPVTADQVKAGLKTISREHVERFKVDGVEYIFPAKLYEAEIGIAEHLDRLLGIRCTTDPDDSVMDELIDEVVADFGFKGLGPEQRIAVKAALSNPVALITGGPGTGKTTIMRVFLECCRRVLGVKNQDIAACAPTGKAAKRLSQASGLEAMTIHRVLEYQPADGEFLYNEGNPLPASIVVIDESSMCDTQVFYWVVQAVATGARLIILGDVDQLPSVGPGKVLKDLIDSGVIPVVRLLEIFRQAAESRIIVNAHRMNNGLVPEIDNASQNNDFFFLRAANDEETAKTLVSLIDRMSTHYKLDRFDDIQILTPQRKGLLGVYELNTRLQKMLNGANLGSGIKLKQDDIDVEFCIGDKVMHIKNNRELGIYNGETGRIQLVDRKARTLSVKVDERVVNYSFADLEELRLAYAMTIHKSQGSEYAAVIMPASESHYNMLNRPLYYTGMTRAKQYLAMVGSVKALQIAASRTSSEKRLTGLLQHLRNVITTLAA